MPSEDRRLLCDLCCSQAQCRGDGLGTPGPARALAILGPGTHTRVATPLTRDSGHVGHSKQRLQVGRQSTHPTTARIQGILLGLNTWIGTVSSLVAFSAFVGGDLSFRRQGGSRRRRESREGLSNHQRATGGFADPLAHRLGKTKRSESDGRAARGRREGKARQGKERGLTAGTRNNRQTGQTRKASGKVWRCVQDRSASPRALPR